MNATSGGIVVRQNFEYYPLFLMHCVSAEAVLQPRMPPLVASMQLTHAILLSELGLTLQQQLPQIVARAGKARCQLPVASLAASGKPLACPGLAYVPLSLLCNSIMCILLLLEALLTSCKPDVDWCHTLSVNLYLLCSCGNA